MKKTVLALIASAFTLQLFALTPKENAFLNDAARGKIEAVEQYVQNGGNINVQFDKTGDTAYHFALANGHGKIAKYLREQGADTTIKNKHAHTGRELGRIFAGARQAKKQQAQGEKGAFGDGAENFENPQQPSRDQEQQDRRDVYQAHKRVVDRTRLSQFTQPL